MDESNLTMEEYIELEAEKAHRHFPAIIYDDALTTDHEVSSETHVMKQLPLRAQRHTWIIYEVEEYTGKIVQDFEERLAGIFVLGLGMPSTFSFQLGGARRQMSWRQFILSMGFHTVEEIAADDFRVYSAESSKTIAFKGDLSCYWDEILSSGDFLTKVPSYIKIRGPLRRLCHRMIAHTITRRGQEPTKGTTVVVRELTEIDLDELSRLHICERVGDT
ncbi:hypothetical protein Tco_0945532 [Tanacetum coccineum]